MANRTRIGSWSSLFDGRRSFAWEISRAKEIGAEWRRDEFQRDIILDEIPGSVDPLWGSDNEWLYIRRPEGLWKTRISSNFNGGTPISLSQKVWGETGESEVFGMMSLGRSLVGHRGWIEGFSVDSPIDAADRDDATSPANNGFDVDADAVATSWGKLLAQTGGEVLVDGGGCFVDRPKFITEGDWLIAIERTTGRRIAYPISLHATYKKALKEGLLWIRIGSRWRPKIDVRVEVQT